MGNAYGHKKILKKNDKKKQEEKANANGMYRRKNNESAKERENEAISHENLEEQLRQKQQNKKQKESNELTMDFFDTMIVPNDDEMDEFINSFAPKMSLLGHGDAASKSVSESKSSSHLIDLKQIRDDMPKKLLLKKKKNVLIKNDTEMHNNTLITDQLKLVWDALNYCQKAGNNTPRRREIIRQCEQCIVSL